MKIKKYHFRLKIGKHLLWYKVLKYQLAKIDIISISVNIKSNLMLVNDLSEQSTTKCEKINENLV